MFSNWFRQSTLDPLSVSMAGVKLADRVVIVGCGDPRLIATLAAKAGLTGRACAVDDDAGRVREAERVALKEGALIEAFTVPLHSMPFEAGSFDVAVLRDIMAAADTRAPSVLHEVLRVLRPGGRTLVVESRRRKTAIDGDTLVAALKSVGFGAVRTLAERDGLLFVEGANRMLNAE